MIKHIPRLNEQPKVFFLEHCHDETKYQTEYEYKKHFYFLFFHCDMVNSLLCEWYFAITKL